MKKEKYATQIQGKISSFCLKHQIEYNKTINMSKSGYPDCLVKVGLITYYFEVKAGNDRLSKLQEETIKKLNKYGEVAFVIESFDDFIKIYEKLPKPDKIIKDEKSKSLLEELDLI